MNSSPHKVDVGDTVKWLIPGNSGIRNHCIIYNRERMMRDGWWIVEPNKIDVWQVSSWEICHTRMVLTEKKHRFLQ
jgi:hypothetical protein